jgi:hypothetical protein
MRKFTRIHSYASEFFFPQIVVICTHTYAHIYTYTPETRFPANCYYMCTMDNVDSNCLRPTSAFYGADVDSDSTCGSKGPPQDFPHERNRKEKVFSPTCFLVSKTSIGKRIHCAAARAVAPATISSPKLSRLLCTFALPWAFSGLRPLILCEDPWATLVDEESTLAGSSHIARRTTCRYLRVGIRPHIS